MKIKLGAVVVDIPKNELNNRSFWNPIGSFLNLPLIERDNQWYRCSLKFIEKEKEVWIQIHDLMIVAEDNTIKYHEQGVIYKEFRIPRYKMHLCNILMNVHPLNNRWFDIRKRIYSRRNTIGVFAFSIMLALIYYFGNEHYENAWARYIGKNGVIQALFILLNIFSIGSVFFPFTIQKQLNEKDIRDICKEEMVEYDKEKIAIKRAEERARI